MLEELISQGQAPRADRRAAAAALELRQRPQEPARRGRLCVTAAGAAARRVTIVGNGVAGFACAKRLASHGRAGRADRAGAAARSAADVQARAPDRAAAGAGRRGDARRGRHRARRRNRARGRPAAPGARSSSSAAGRAPSAPSRGRSCGRPGVHHRAAPVAGGELAHLVATAEGFAAITEQLSARPGQRVAVIGAGLVGAESGGDARDGARGHADRRRDAAARPARQPAAGARRVGARRAGRAIPGRLRHRADRARRRGLPDRHGDARHDRRRSRRRRRGHGADRHAGARRRAGTSSSSTRSVVYPAPIACGGVATARASCTRATGASRSRTGTGRARRRSTRPTASRVAGRRSPREPYWFSTIGGTHLQGFGVAAGRRSGRAPADSTRVAARTGRSCAALLVNAPARMAEAKALLG